MTGHNGSRARRAVVKGATMVAGMPVVQDQVRRLATTWRPAARRRRVPAAAALGLGLGPAALLVLVGAGCMYLMDPENGRRRREMIRDTATDWWEQARARVARGWARADAGTTTFGGSDATFGRDREERYTETGPPTPIR
ncbi:MAG TPA: hypothetical protein VMT79_03385 [Candidatus Binatia bacterium]|nr:hypothetical protein [Candidatus Binatia bacterium]